MLTRRTLIAGIAATALAPAAFADSANVAYAPGVIEAALADGKTVFVDYFASWCSTCRAQKRVVDALRQANPAYDANMVFVKVDWDQYSSHQVATSRNIPRRSTLIVLKGDAELGRIVAGTSKSEIKALLDTGLAAAS